MSPPPGEPEPEVSFRKFYVYVLVVYLCVMGGDTKYRVLRDACKQICS